MLHEFLTLHREDIIARTRAKVATRMAPRPTKDELENGVPLFLDQLAETLRCEQETEARQTSDQMARSAARYGGELREAGFTVGQVVHGYGDVCQAVTELAIELEIPITADEFKTLNRCLDEAIAQAVTEFARQRDVTALGPRHRAPGFLRPRAPEPPVQRAARLRGPEERDGRDRRQHGRRPRAQPGRAARPHRPFTRRSAARGRCPSPRARPAHRAHGRGRGGGGDRSQRPGAPAHGHAGGAGGDDRRGSPAHRRGPRQPASERFQVQPSQGPCRAEVGQRARFREGPDRGRGRVRRASAGPGRRPVPPVRAAQRRSERAGARAGHRPRQRREQRRRDPRAERAGPRMHLRDRAAVGGFRIAGRRPAISPWPATRGPTRPRACSPSGTAPRRARR